MYLAVRAMLGLTVGREEIGNSWGVACRCFDFKRSERLQVAHQEKLEILLQAEVGPETRHS